MSLFKCKGAIFDMDGVITKTAVVHFRAWKTIFDDYLKMKAGGKNYIPFTHENDYLPFVDGKPRYQGVQSFLESRDITIPFGSQKDSSLKNTVCGLGNKKNLVFREIIEKDGIEIYESTLSLIRELKSKGVKIGVASSSKNCKFILKTTGLLDLFKVIIGGRISKELGLKGKPDPDIFLAAATNLKVHPNECLMVEDAISGVKAGKNGNFGLVIGVARNGDKEVLRAKGADIVVEDMNEIGCDDIETWFKDGLKNDNWNLSYYGFERELERLRETLTTVGNGYFGTRGSFEGVKADAAIHYPGTYIAGVYNKLPSIVHKKTIYNNDFVNCPNWLLIEIKIGEDHFIDPLKEEVIYYKHNLNMKDGLMSRLITFKDKKGRITTIESSRFASMDNPHLAAIRYKIIPSNYSESVVIRSTLDGSVINSGVPRYRDLNSIHLTPLSLGGDNDQIYLNVETKTSGVKIFMASRSYIFKDESLLNVKRKIEKKANIVSENAKVDVLQGHICTFEKYVSIYTSKDIDVEDGQEEAKSLLMEVSGFDQLFELHKKAWHKLWDKADMVVDGDRFAQKTLRLHIYHLLVTASFHNKYIDAGMPARGLHGEAYRGHIFWDELFIFPFFNHRFPEITRALLMYRYNRLDAARKNAKDNGYLGAMYPWQAADGGDEETPIIHFNPVSGNWAPDLSRRQRHVSIAIAYNVLEYFQTTNDLDFLNNYGAEIIFEITRFWASIAEYSDKDNKYHINGVMGPDEFHEKYPDSDKDGINDNSYTNIMVSWIIGRAVDIASSLSSDVIKNLSKKISFDLKELDEWKKLISKMNIEINDEKILSQFKGYMDLKELNWSHYEEKYGNIHRMDRILKSEGDSPDNYRLSKQADVLMLFYLFAPHEVKNILESIGYEIDDEVKFIKKNYDFYIKRTSHGSTLSHVVHAAVLKHLNTNKKDIWLWFLNALRSDIYDTQGGTTVEGIHCGVMAGTLDIVFKNFAGIIFFKDRVKVNPNLPKHWKKLSFSALHRNNLFKFEINASKVKISLDGRPDAKFEVEIGKDKYVLDNHGMVESKYAKKGHI